jgi:alpha-tubulin suppressor-like RCC1 family protein
MVQLAAGLQHSLVVRDGQVLRTGVRNGRLLPKPGDWDLTLGPVPGLEAHHAVGVSAGFHHSLVLTDTGTVLGFGTSQFGQLGLGVFNDVEVLPTVIPLPDGLRARAIAAGWFHSLVLDEHGGVWGFGLGKHHQLGVGRKTPDNPTPQRLPLDRSVVVSALGAGSTHSALLTNDGALYTFGRGNAGALGCKPAREQRTPKRVDDVPPLMAVALGVNHTLALTVTGQLLACGDGARGQLGFRATRLCPTLTPIAGLAGQRVTRIAAGRSHSAAVTEDGQLFTFGWGAFGALGHGDAEDAHEPRRVQAPRRAARGRRGRRSRPHAGAHREWPGLRVG